MACQILRITALVLLVALGAAIPVNVATSLSELCCDDAPTAHAQVDHEDQDDGCPEEHEGDCECPLGCVTCCSGSPARAIAPASPELIEAPGRALTPLRFEVYRSPPQGVSRGILHVPKLAA